MSEETKKFVMSQEILDKLTGYLPMTSESEYSFVPKFFKEIEEIPEEFKPVFKIRQLTKEESVEVRKILAGLFDDLHGQKGKKFSLDAQIAKAVTRDDKFEVILKKVILGWKNLYKMDGSGEFRYSTDNVSFLTQNLKGEILNKIIEISGIAPKGASIV